MFSTFWLVQLGIVRLARLDKTPCALAVVLLALVENPAQGQSMFSGYDEFCGLPIYQERIPHMAEADYRYGQRVIILDPGVASNWTTSRMFAVAHECAHHKLGHVTWLAAVLNKRELHKVRSEELAADCWAASALAKNGFRNDLARVIAEHASQGQINRFPYPTGSERSKVILSCAEITKAQLEAFRHASTERNSNMSDGSITKQNSDSTCGKFEQIVDAAPRQFRSIRGKALPRDFEFENIYQSKVGFQGFRCSISVDRIEPSTHDSFFECYTKERGYSRAKKFYQKYRNAFLQCPVFKEMEVDQRQNNSGFEQTSAYRETRSGGISLEIEIDPDGDEYYLRLDVISIVE